MYLVLSMGGAVTNIENQGFGDSTTWTGNGFEKISAVHWTLTSRDSNYWLVGHNNGEFGAWATGRVHNLGLVSLCAHNRIKS